MNWLIRLLSDIRHGLYLRNRDYIGTRSKGSDKKPTQRLSRPR